LHQPFAPALCSGNFRNFQSWVPQAVGVFKSRSRDSARVPSTPRRRPATSKAAKQTNAPFPDRDLDPPLELYCW
jgi:hypothetical protein